MVRPDPGAVVRDLHDRDGRRDQPRAVRPPRGRGRAGRRLPHRVLLAEVRAVLPGRVHQHGDRLGAGDDAVPRRLARAVLDRPRVGPGANSGYWPFLWFIGKVLFFIFFFIWLRGTLPRLRYDQFMAFGWKRLIPFSLVWIIAVATIRVDLARRRRRPAVPPDRPRHRRRAVPRRVLLRRPGEGGRRGARAHPAGLRRRVPGAADAGRWRRPRRRRRRSRSTPAARSRPSRRTSTSD